MKFLQSAVKNLTFSTILNEIALGQKQNMNKDLRGNLNTHDVTKAIEQGSEVNIFSFFKKSQN